VECDRRDRCRPRLDRRVDNGGELRLAVRQSGDDRSHHDTARHTRIVEPTDDVHPQPRMRRARLGEAPHVFVERPDGQVHVQRGPPNRFGEQLHVAQDQRRFGEDRERVPRLDEEADHPLREVVLALGPLVRVGVRSHRDRMAGPAPRRKLEP
jgi:hypothetical protein